MGGGRGGGVQGVKRKGRMVEQSPSDRPLLFFPEKLARGTKPVERAGNCVTWQKKKEAGEKRKTRKHQTIVTRMS